jgi:hypothetical protein
MFRTIKPLSALALLFSVAGAACTAAPGPEAGSTAEGDTKAANYFSCHHDDDCVAVARVGCCSNGWKEAVNVDKVDAYEASGPKVCNMMCPMFMVDDTRVAQCDTAAHKCEMVQPDEITCGGFVANAHHCPDGYDCINDGHVPDVPGTCKKHVDADDAGPGPDDDAATDGGTPDDSGDHVTCLTLECEQGYHCCSGPLTANGPLGDATCQPNGTFCPL